MARSAKDRREDGDVSGPRAPTPTLQSTTPAARLPGGGRPFPFPRGFSSNSHLNSLTPWKSREIVAWLASDPVLFRITHTILSYPDGKSRRLLGAAAVPSVMAFSSPTPARPDDPAATF